MFHLGSKMIMLFLEHNLGVMFYRFFVTGFSLLLLCSVQDKYHRKMLALTLCKQVTSIQIEIPVGNKLSDLVLFF